MRLSKWSVACWFLIAACRMTSRRAAATPWMARPPRTPPDTAPVLSLSSASSRVAIRTASPVWRASPRRRSPASQLFARWRCHQCGCRTTTIIPGSPLRRLATQVEINDRGLMSSLTVNKLSYEWKRFYQVPGVVVICGNLQRRLISMNMECRCWKVRLKISKRTSVSVVENHIQSTPSPCFQRNS